MTLSIARFFSFLVVALSLVPARAHLIELPNKINLSAEEYLTVQQLYRGWALAGIVVGALISALGLFAVAAFLLVVVAQIVSWTFT